MFSKVKFKVYKVYKNKEDLVRIEVIDNLTDTIIKNYIIALDNLILPELSNNQLFILKKKINDEFRRRSLRENAIKEAENV